MVGGRSLLGRVRQLAGTFGFGTKFALGAILAVAALAPAAYAASAKASKPSLFVTGIAINTVNLIPGTTVTSTSGACYEMLGANGAPNSITAVGLLSADGIPSTATTALKLVTPWGKVVDTARFSKALFVDPKSTWGGVVPPGTYFRWSNTQGGSVQKLDGDYLFSVSVKVGGRTVTAHGSLEIRC